MNYIGLNKFDTANGEGIRVSLFVSGCRMHCKGCFNKESWDFNAGKPFRVDEEGRLIVAWLSNPSVSGLSVLGGEPFEPEHEDALLNLFVSVKMWYPEKDIWVWTGRKYEQIKNSPFLNYIDVLVDGAFVEHLKVKGKYYGSSNQRILRRSGNEWIADKVEGSASEDTRKPKSIRIACEC